MILLYYQNGPATIAGPRQAVDKAAIVILHGSKKTYVVGCNCKNLDESIIQSRLLQFCRLVLRLS